MSVFRDERWGSFNKLAQVYEVPNRIAFGHQHETALIMPSRRHCKGERDQQTQQCHARVGELQGRIVIRLPRRPATRAPTDAPAGKHDGRKN